MRTLFATMALALVTGLAAAQEIAPRKPVRDVTPPGVTRAFRTDIPARDIENQGKHIEKVRLRPDGSLWGDGSIITLEAVSLPERKRICRSDDGTRWACGAMAYVVLQNFIASGSMICEINQDGHPSGHCKVAGLDASTFLLENGWADLREPAADKHRRAATRAKTNLVGMWSPHAPTSRAGR